MQSELERGQKKFMKFEMKKGGIKEEYKHWLKQGFPKSIERCRGGRAEILFGGILTTQWFCHAEDKIL